MWYCHGDNSSRLCIVWDVHFSGLVYLAGKVGTNCCRFFIYVKLVKTVMSCLALLTLTAICLAGKANI